MRPLREERPALRPPSPVVRSGARAPFLQQPPAASIAPHDLVKGRNDCIESGLMNRGTQLDREHSDGRAMIKTVLVIVALLAMGATAMAETVRFDADAVGKAPAGWTQAKTGKGDSRWTVEEDPTAPSRSKVVKQSGRASYPLLFRNGTSLKDGFIDVRFKALSGSEDRAAGLVWRARDADNYYVVRANALEDNVVLYKTVNGVRSSLDIVGRKGGYGVKAPVPAQQWHRLRVEFKGRRFKVVYDGRELFEVEDATFGDAGMVGLWTKADSVTLFDEITYGETE
jgi:3-keto-disaccharide hydrolase